MFINKFIIIGIIIIILGFFLTPIFIGFPIMMIGFLIGDFGVVYGIVQKVPGLEDKIRIFFTTIKESYKPYFRKVSKESNKVEEVNKK